jgi:hypothetical protein
MAIDGREMNRRLIKLSESSTSRFWRLDYGDLSPPERVFLLVWELESEVNNGGLPTALSARWTMSAVASAPMAYHRLVR